ncbi:MAG: HEAT repeat domain-containing protein [Planctomycetota bacterium]
MRSIPALILFPILGLALGCQSPRDESKVTNIVEVGAAEERPEFTSDENAKLVKNTEDSVKRYEELRIQGLTRAMTALRGSIATSVDQDFEIFRDMALEGELNLHRNMALKCLGFADERKADSREALILIASNPKEQIFLRANAMRGLGILRDPETPLEPVVAMLGAGNPSMRTEAAETFKELALVKPTPRKLTPQYITAMERLATMLYDENNRPGRRASVWALANLRHPDTLEHLLAALDDQDEQVQIGALRGLELLGDQRALEPLLAYLDDGPPEGPKSWCIKSLKVIAVQGGFAKDRSELIPLGDNVRKWEEFFRKARMK